MSKVEYKPVPGADSSGVVQEAIIDELPVALTFTAKIRHSFTSASGVFWNSGIFCGLFAAFAFSCTALFVKLVGNDVSAVEIVFVRATLSLVVTVVTARIAGIAPILGKRENLKLLIGRGVCGACAMTSYYICVTLLPLGDAVTLFFLNPSLTALLAFLILHEPLGWLGVVGVVVSLGGMVLLSAPPFLFGGESWSEQRVLGTFLGLISAVFSAGTFMFMRLLSGREPPLVLTMYFYIISLIVCIGPLAASWPNRAVMPNLVQWALLMGVAATSFVAQISTTRSFHLLPAAKASGIKFTQVVYSYGFGILCLHESMTFKGSIGAVLIAFGAALVNVRSQQKSSKTAATSADGQNAYAPLQSSDEAETEGLEMVKGTLEGVNAVGSEGKLGGHVVVEVRNVSQPKRLELDGSRESGREHLLEHDEEEEKR